MASAARDSEPAYSALNVSYPARTTGAPTLGLFKPRKIERLIIEPATPEWSVKQQEILRTDTLFQKAPAQTLEKIPYNFKYEFLCVETTCSGHTMTCFDWEMLDSFRRWRREYGDQWQKAFRQTFEQEMIKKNDTHFFVGTVHLHPGNWIIVGLFYPPHSSRGLFD
jgi:hypothetical protein